MTKTLKWISIIRWLAKTFSLQERYLKYVNPLKKNWRKYFPAAVVAAEAVAAKMTVVVLITTTTTMAAAVAVN